MTSFSEVPSWSARIFNFSLLDSFIRKLFLTLLFSLLLATRDIAALIVCCSSAPFVLFFDFTASLDGFLVALPSEAFKGVSTAFFSSMLTSLPWSSFIGCFGLSVTGTFFSFSSCYSKKYHTFV